MVSPFLRRMGYSSLDISRDYQGFWRSLKGLASSMAQGEAGELRVILLLTELTGKKLPPGALLLKRRFDFLLTLNIWKPLTFLSTLEIGSLFPSKVRRCLNSGTAASFSIQIPTSSSFYLHSVIFRELFAFISFNWMDSVKGLLAAGIILFIGVCYFEWL